MQWLCNGASSSKAAVEEIHLASFVRIEMEARTICYGSALVSVGDIPILGRSRADSHARSQPSESQYDSPCRRRNVSDFLEQDPPVRSRFAQPSYLTTQYVNTRLSSPTNPSSSPFSPAETSTTVARFLPTDALFESPEAECGRKRSRSLNIVNLTSKDISIKKKKKKNRPCVPELAYTFFVWGYGPLMVFSDARIVCEEYEGLG